MGRVSKTTADYEAASKMLDQRALAIGDHDSIHVGIGKAVDSSSETREKEAGELSNMK